MSHGGLGPSADRPATTSPDLTSDTSLHLSEHTGQEAFSGGGAGSGAGRDNNSAIVASAAAVTTAPYALGDQDEAYGNDAQNLALSGTVLTPDDIRCIIRIVQCGQCSYPLNNPVTLPCGQSLCKSCLPKSYLRSNISYPATANRRQGFRCPYSECGKEHALNDCSVDVILNKAIGHIKAEIALQSARTRFRLSTRLRPLNHVAITGIPSMTDPVKSQLIPGGRLSATYASIESGNLNYESDVIYEQDIGPSEPPYPNEELASPKSEHSDECHDDNASSTPQNETTTEDGLTYDRISACARTEMDCQVCYALFYDPITTACGHTFCRGCLYRILDHSTYCPICRRQLFLDRNGLSHDSYPSNINLIKMIKTFWIDELKLRGEMIAAEEASRHGEFDTPIFVCTLSFPAMPTFLHVFEPRYRLMIRRAAESNGLFGMVLSKEPTFTGDAHFHETGTLLRIINVEYYSDGRSMLETVGVSRFKVKEHGFLDGYTVAKTVPVDDISLAEEEALEAAELAALAATRRRSRSQGSQIDQPMSGNLQTRNVDDNSSQDDEESVYEDALDPMSPEYTGRAEEPIEEEPLEEQNQRGPTTVSDLDMLPTQELMKFAAGFVDRMQHASVPWLASRILALYGQCPQDPAVFPWWLASILPVRETEKYKLLNTLSVRERLKLCCTWIMEWEARRWSLSRDCRIL